MMKTVVALFALVAAICAPGGEKGRLPEGSAQALDKGFRNPPDSARPHTWYHMMNGNVTKEGLTCDFEAIARVGLGGVQMFDAGCDVPSGSVAFNSPEWFDLLKHAASEARRLGLEICIPNCSGWSSSGGPWIMPSNGMKVVTWRDVKVKGPSRFHARLPRETKDNGFYEDIAVVAFPTPPAESVEFRGARTSVADSSIAISSDEPFTAPAVSFKIDCGGIWSGDADADVETSQDGQSFSRLESFRVPIARHGVRNQGELYHAFPSPVTARAIRIVFTKSPVRLKPVSARLDARAKMADLPFKTFAMRGECARDKAVAGPGQTVAKGSVRDITACLAPDGTLDWDVPAGDWTIVRIGFACNGRCNHPASEKGRGLEVDKLSASAMDFHFGQYVGRLCEHLGPLAGDVQSGLNNILVDSYEVGSQNWTQGLDGTFEARMGYSLRPYLPVFAGRIVGSMDESERFLEDFRRVVADLFAENYAGRLAELCHGRGLKLSLEPYGSCPADNLQYGQDVDIPMGEFWSSARIGARNTNTGNSRFAAHLAHVWGRRYAATESFTASPPGGGRWRTTPFMIKAQGDSVYCDGVNRIIYHRFTHQPWPGSKYVPGMTMGRWGMHLDRTQTWWELSKPWFRYQARCQWMLQEGVFVADALYFCGEQTPNRGNTVDGFGTIGADDMKLPDGYDWDICATKALKALKVVDGRVVVPGGVAYRLLVLPPSDTMSEELLDKVESLLDAGAKVCGMEKPVRAPGLRGYPAADGRVRERAERIWAKGVLTCRPAEAIARLGVEPDFASSQKDPAPRWIHRRGNGADWYFVALNNAQQCTFEASFRLTGRIPEIWDAESGEMRRAVSWREEGSRTFVTLSFPPSGSAFVVFRGKRDEGRGMREEGMVANAPAVSVVPVSGPWRVTFPVDWYFGEECKIENEKCKVVEWDELKDWAKDDNPDIKYFSGTAVYNCKVENVKCKVGDNSRIVLDLGDVKDFAEVTVNGRAYEVLWRPPFRVDVTDALDGADALDVSVRVTNLWPNRLIGDDRLHEDDCEWKACVRGNGDRELGIKELPQWVRDGKPSPAGRHTFTTWKHWNKDDALLPSGLLGPVSLRICRAEDRSDSMSPIQECARIFEADIRDGVIHGAAVVAGGLEGETLSGEWGWADAAHTVPMTTRTVIDMASVTKAAAGITAFLVAHAKGMVDFDAPFTNYLASYKATLPRAVTVRDLANHVSGFGEADGTPRAYFSHDAKTMLDNVLSMPPKEPTAGKVFYSCRNYVLLGQAFEAATGRGAAEFCCREIFGPLGMKDTFIGAPPPGVGADRLAQTMGTERPGVISDFVAQPLWRAGIGTFNAGMFSTAEDMAKLMRAYLRGGVADDGTRLFGAAEMAEIAPSPTNHVDGARSFGWQSFADGMPEHLFGTSLFHSGWSGQTVLFDLKRRRYAIVLTTRCGDYARAKRDRFAAVAALTRAVGCGKGNAEYYSP